MSNAQNLNVGEVISFETIAPAILNLRYDQVKFDGIVGYRAASSFADIPTLHRMLYPSMDQATVMDDYRSYDYLSFYATSGPQANVVQVLGLPWIRDETIEVTGNENLMVMFQNISPRNKEFLFQLLRANGLVNFQVVGE